MQLVARSGGRKLPEPPSEVERILGKETVSDDEMKVIMMSVLDQEDFRKNLDEFDHGVKTLWALMEKVRLDLTDDSDFVNIEMGKRSVSTPFYALTAVHSFLKSKKLVLAVLEMAKKNAENLHGPTEEFVTRAMDIMSMEVSTETIEKLGDLVSTDYHKYGHFDNLIPWSGTYSQWEKIPEVIYYPERPPGILDRFWRRNQDRQKNALSKYYEVLRQQAGGYIEKWEGPLLEALEVVREVLEAFSPILVPMKITGELNVRR